MRGAFGTNHALPSSSSISYRLAMSVAIVSRSLLQSIEPAISRLQTALQRHGEEKHREFLSGEAEQPRTALASSNPILAVSPPRQILKLFWPSLGLAWDHLEGKHWSL